MPSLGSLVVSLEANIARFSGDMRRAADQTEEAMRRMGRAADLAKTALTAIGVGASIAGFGMIVKGAIDAADSLRDMSQKTGIAVETLNGLGFAAGQAGGSLESIVSAAGKLNKSIAEAAGGNKETAEGFNVLGISVLDAAGNLKHADVVMAEVADRFATFQDGPEKTAIALRIFGKAGADMIPILNDGGNAMRENIEYSKKYSGMTTELSDAADNFNDTLGKLTLQQKGFGNAMAAAVLPILQLIANETLSAAENTDRYSLATKIVKTILETFVIVGSEVAFTFTQIGTGIGGAIARFQMLAELDFKGFKGIGKSLESDLIEAKKKHDEFIANVLNPKAPAASVVDPAAIAKTVAPRMKATGQIAAGPTNDPAKKEFEGHLKSLEAAMAKENSALEFGNKFVQMLRNQDAIDIANYNDYREKSLESGLAIAIKTYDAEIAEAKRYQATTEKMTEKASAQNKIDEAKAKKSKAIQDAGNAQILMTLGLAEAQAKLNKDSIDWTRQQENTADLMQFQIDMLGRSTIEVEKLSAAKRIQLEVEETIRRAQEKTATPIDRTAFDATRDAAIKKSNSLIDQADTKTKDPWFNMTESIRRYGEEASNAGAQIGNVMSNAFRGAEDALTTFISTGKISFSGFAQSIIADLARIQAKKMISALATSLSGSGGFLGMLGGLFAGGGKAAGGGVNVGGMYPVGENGPEMFIPTSAGSISPNKGGSTINYAPVINIDASTDRAQVQQLVFQAVSKGNADLVDQLQRARKL